MSRGAVTAWTEKAWDFAWKVLAGVWEEYGLFAALLIIFFMYHVWFTQRLWRARLGDKDKEIDRLVEERNRLQDVILKRRLSTSGRKR